MIDITYEDGKLRLFIDGFEIESFDAYEIKDNFVCLYCYYECKIDKFVYIHTDTKEAMVVHRYFGVRFCKCDADDKTIKILIKCFPDKYKP